MKKQDLNDKILIELEETNKFSTIGLISNCVYKDKDMRICRTETTLFDKDNKPYKGFNSYEIFKRKYRKFNKIQKIDGKIVNTTSNNVYKEIYPCSEDFGNFAWSCSSEGSVHKILKNHFKKSEEEINTLLSILNFN